MSLLSFAVFLFWVSLISVVIELNGSDFSVSISEFSCCFNAVILLYCKYLYRGQVYKLQVAANLCFWYGHCSSFKAERSNAFPNILSPIWCYIWVYTMIYSVRCDSVKILLLQVSSRRQTRHKSRRRQENKTKQRSGARQPTKIKCKFISNFNLSQRSFSQSKH